MRRRSPRRHRHRERARTPGGRGPPASRSAGAVLIPCLSSHARAADRVDHESASAPGPVGPRSLRRAPVGISQVTLMDSWTFSRQGQAECAEFVADRNVDVEKLFTHRSKLEQAEDAYKLFDTQTTGKAVILPS